MVCVIRVPRCRFIATTRRPTRIRERPGSALVSRAPSEFLCVSDDGQYVAFVNIGRYDWEFLEEHNGMPLAVRIYRADGKLLKQFILSDVLSEDEIDCCAETGSTIQWLDGVEFNKWGAFDLWSGQVYPWIRSSLSN